MRDGMELGHRRPGMGGAGDLFRRPRQDAVLRVHADVAKVLKSNQNKYLEELEEVLRRPVLIKGDSQLHHEKFDLA